MSKHYSMNEELEAAPVTDEAMERESCRILRRLNESGACLAVAKEMDLRPVTQVKVHPKWFAYRYRPKERVR